MQIPVEVTFKGVPVSDAVQAAAWKHADELERVYGRITSCRVVIDAPHRHQHKGRLYDVRVDVTVPGEELIAGRGHPQDHAHEDVYIAMRDAFRAARRQLEDRVRKMRGFVKSRAGADTGRVLRLLPEYGFLEAPDGREVYFHRRAVVTGDYERLEEGDEVRFTEELGEEGPQASTVHVAHPRRQGRAASQARR